MWLSAVETAAKLNTLPELEVLDTFFAFSRLWSRAIYPDDYTACECWNDVLVPTEEGAPYVEEAKASCATIPAPDVYLALFCIFSHTELIFDWTKSNINEIQSVLNRELRECHIRLPYMF